MNKFSKVAIFSSVVLGATLFSVGCGGDSFCCKDGEPPIPKIADAGTQSANYANGQYTLTSNKSLKLNGLQDSVDTDNGQVVKCNWYIADEAKDGSAKSKKLVKKDSCENVEIDFSKFANGTKKLVCLEVIDNNGLSSNLNNGYISDFNGAGKIREGAKQGVEGRKKLDCRRVVIGSDPVINPTKPEFKIYNARDNQETGSSPVKQNCPFYFKPVNEVTTNTTCEWTIDGTKVSEDCGGVFDQHRNDLNPHEICLITNGDVAGKECHNFQAVEHTAPTAVMNVYYEGETTPITTGILKATKTIYLSCKDSKNDCPGDNSGLECKWDASSYEAVNGSCDVPEGDRVYNYQDCFDDQNHTDHGPQTTLASEEIITKLRDHAEDSKLTYQYVCGSATRKCVEVKLTVTDKRFDPNKTSTTVTRHFKVEK